MSQSTLQYYGAGPAAMPSRRSHHAPYFSGRVHDPIEDFLSEYEELANSCDLTDRQKVETIIRYIPLTLRDFWKSLDGYLAHDWTDFRRQLEDFYHRPALSRHSKKKFLDFVRLSSKSRMDDEEDVLHYYRQFLVLSKPLLDSQRLTTGERNKAFWCGFHSRDRPEMYVRLIAKHPDHPSCVYFDYLDVYEVARVTFSGDHILDLELDDLWDELQSTRSRRLERVQERWLDQEERDPRGVDPNYRTHERRRPRSPLDYTLRDTQYQRSDARRTPPPEIEDKVVRLREPLREEEDREIEDLVKRMHGLSVYEESYAVLYARCAHRFPNVAQYLPMPVFAQYTPAPVATSSPQFSMPPPHISPRPNNCTPSVRIEEVTGYCASYQRR